MPPSLFAALGLGLRALLREPWLLAVGMLVALVRRAALWPAWTVAWVVLLRAAVLAAPRRPFDLAAPVQGALAALVAPRFVALVLGLALAGLAVGAALRVTAHAAERGGSPLLAAAVASALTVAIAVPLALSAVADAGVARAAVRGEGPARAIASSGARFLARPGTFLLAALAFGLAALLGPGLVSGAGRIATGFAYGVSPLVLVGPRLMLATFAATVAAAIDLVWLGTVTALACGDDDR